MDGFQIAVAAAFSFPVFSAALAGVAWGIIGGALPGLSASITMALLLPFTYGMDPTVAITLLASTYVGAEYGGSIPAILIRTPGTGAAAATVADGYAMHLKGRGDEALGLSLAAGVVGGLIGMIVLVFLTSPLAKAALLFTPPSYFALAVLGLSIVASVSEGTVIRGLIAACIGLAIATIGSDPMTAIPRFTFDRVELYSGVRPILVLIGVFAISEMLIQASAPQWAKSSSRMRIKLPSLAMWKRIGPSVGIGSVAGSLEGVTPGAGGSVASFLAYNEARRWSRHKEEFGHGSPEGVAAPEAANNAVAATALIPTLSFGVPGSNSTAVLLGGLLIHGIEPGPMLFVRHPDLVYGLYGGLFVANLAQLLLGLIMLGPCLWLVNRPRPYLMGFILALVFTGVYTLDGSVFDLSIVLCGGVGGYILRKLGFPILPLVLGLVLGSMVEQNYRRALQLAGGDYTTFFTDPVSVILLSLSAAIAFSSLLAPLLKRKAARMTETTT
jgi:putative tricarboxylic transport membrane protein